MQDFSPICKKYNTANLKITYKWKNKRKEIALRDILPRDFCILAFHSVYAYMLTFFNGGWFNWVNYNESVIVNCPSPEGIAMYVKHSSGNSPDNFQIEVMKTNCRCYKKYNLKDNFPISFNKERDLRYKMLYEIIPFLAEFLLRKSPPRDFSCVYNDDVVEYQVELNR